MRHSLRPDAISNGNTFSRVCVPRCAVFIGWARVPRPSSPSDLGFIPAQSRHCSSQTILCSCPSVAQGPTATIAMPPAIPTSAAERVCVGTSCNWHYQSTAGFASSASARRFKQRLVSCAVAAAQPPPPPSASPEAWSVDEIQSLGQDKEVVEEAVLGQTWRSNFADNPTLLYDYVDEAHGRAWQRQLEQVVGTSRTKQEGLIPQFPAAMANDLVGMGTWRLKGSVDGIIEFLVARIEGSWREMLDEDLTLYPQEKWKANGLDFVDSLDPTNEWDQFAYVDVPDPAEGAEGYPRLQLENRVYCSRVFRKLHAEVVWRQDDLDVLHVVLYPRYEFDLPILAMDIVSMKGAITLAVVDACPTRPNQQLPMHYLQTMQQLQDTFLPDLPRRRKVPEWGSKIFSPMVVCITPQSAEQLAGFVKYTVALHRAHLQLSKLVQPIDIQDRRGKARRAELLQGHRNFVKNQLENKKTRRVLEMAFGAAWADEYMTKIMFDFDPLDDPPWVDGELNKFYDYFDYYPELGTARDEILSIREKLDMDKANEIFEQVVTGEADQVSRPQVEWALQHLYTNDEAFRSSIRTLLPDADELHDSKQLGKVLASQIQGLSASREAWTKDPEEVEGAIDTPLGEADEAAEADEDQQQAAVRKGPQTLSPLLRKIEPFSL